MNLRPAKISYTVQKKQTHIIIKESIGKLGFIKMKNVYSSEDKNNSKKTTQRLGEDICNTYSTKDTSRVKKNPKN